jgi:hypothetical protein
VILALWLLENELAWNIEEIPSNRELEKGALRILPIFRWSLLTHEFTFHDAMEVGLPEPAQAIIYQP